MTFYLNSPAFDEIIEGIAQSAQLIRYRREQNKHNHNYFRVNVTLRCPDNRLIDLFHSSATGYRAQYYLDPALGEWANKRAIDSVAPRLFDLVGAVPKRTCADDWCASSIYDDSSKIWIYQGRWFRSPSYLDRLLEIERWDADHAADKTAKKRCRWSELAPFSEDRLNIKGGWISLKGRRLPSLKPQRSRNINENGYT
jgi:hypothetical protein